MNNKKNNKNYLVTTMMIISLFLLLSVSSLAAPLAPPQTPPPITLPPGEKPTISLLVDNTTITKGEPIIFSWTTQNVTTGCQAAGNITDWNGPKPTFNEDQIILTNNIDPGKYSLGLTCTNEHGSTTKTENITVYHAQAPTISLSVDNTTVAQGETIVFYWSTQDADHCQAAGNITGWTGTKPTNISYQPLATTNTQPGTYSLGLRCTNQYSPTTQIKNITVTLVHEVNITLLEPAPGTKKKMGAVNFTATTQATTQITCALQIHNQAITNYTAPINDQLLFTHEFNETLTGFWRIHCKNEEHQLQAQSVERSIEITQKDSILNTNKQRYAPGERINFTLEGFTGATVLTMPRAIASTPIVVNKDPYEGNVTLNLSATPGLYNLTAASTTNQNMTDTVVINITLPQPKIFVSKNETVTNDTISIYGNSFIPEQDLTIFITQPTTAFEKTITVTTDKDGIFLTNYTTDLLGVYVVTGVHDLRADINASTNFSVSKPKEEPPEPECTTNTQCDTGETCEAGKCVEEQTQTPTPCATCERGGVCYPQGAILGGEYCLGTSFQAQKNDGATCTANYECERGQCTQGVCGGPTQTTTQPPIINQPTPTVEESSSSFFWWMIIFVIIVGLIGGFFGFLAYEDALDMSSPQGFIDGVKDAFTQGTTNNYTPPMSTPNTFSKETLPKPPTTATNLSPHEQKAMSYINEKRSQGYDDLTIRNALLKQGWPEPEVDGVFDKLYN